MPEDNRRAMDDRRCLLFMSGAARPVRGVSHDCRLTGQHLSASPRGPPPSACDRFPRSPRLRAIPRRLVLLGITMSPAEAGVISMDGAAVAHGARSFCTAAPYLLTHHGCPAVRPSRSGEDLSEYTPSSGRVTEQTPQAAPELFVCGRLPCPLSHGQSRLTYGRGSVGSYLCRSVIHVSTRGESAVRCTPSGQFAVAPPPEPRRQTDRGASHSAFQGRHSGPGAGESRLS